MLVLSRKPGETVHIGTGVTVTVLKVCGKRVKLGIAGPRDVVVMRGELPRKAAAQPARAYASPTAEVCGVP